MNEQVMIGRIDQQILVNKLMFDAYSLPEDVFNRRLSQYMMSYLAMICLVTSIMLTISGTEENKQKRKELWQYFRENDVGMYKRLRREMCIRDRCGRPEKVTGFLPQGRWALEIQRAAAQ